MTEREIFTEALTLPVAERPTYLERVCGGDTAGLARLQKLLALHENDCPLLDQPAEELAEPLRPNDTPDGVLALLSPLLQPSSRPGAVGRLGHYDLLEVLGCGGCGVVFRALDEKLHRVVAVKVLSPNLTATSPPRQRFLREARSAARVRHENVVQVYAVEETPIPYLVMEYVDGPTLQTRLDTEGPLAPAEVARLGRQVALGLAAAHERGLIHRDVKPANILLDAGPEPRARLTDFGLARAADDASLTQSGVLAGTPLFMSPEQARGSEVLDHRADLFSLGSVLYTMAAGRPPFRAPTPLAVLKRVSEDAPRPLAEVIEGIPPGLVAVIGRLMEKTPAARYSSAAAAADALATALTAPPPPSSWRRPLRLAGAGALLLVVCLVGALWGGPLWFGPSTEENADTSPTRPENPPPALVSQSEPKATPAPLPANALVVNSTADDGRPGTLRWAIEQADTRPGEDLIVFDPEVFATRQTISLTLGEFKISDPAPTTLQGPPAGVILSGKENQYRQGFYIHSEKGGPAVVTMRRVTLRDFDLRTGNGSRGAAINVGNGDVVLDQVTVANNFCNFGGGIVNHGLLRITHSTFTGNASTVGGAILNFGILTIINSTFSQNRADGTGSAIHNSGGTAKILCSTLTANRSGSKEGALSSKREKGSLTVVNSIVAGNKGGSEPDLFGAATVTNSLIGGASSEVFLPGSARNITGESPRLGPLGNNGGLTETHALLTDSPAIGAGDRDALQPNIKTDQRGLPRVVNGRLDLGAFQQQ